MKKHYLLILLVFLFQCFEPLKHKENCDYISEENICLIKNGYKIDNEEFQLTLDLIHSIVLEEGRPYTYYWLKKLYRKRLVIVKFVHEIKGVESYPGGILDNTTYPEITAIIVYRDNSECNLSDGLLVHEMLHLFIWDAERLSVKEGWIHKESRFPPYLLEWEIQKIVRKEICE